MNAEFKEQGAGREPLESTPDEDLDLQPFANWVTISQFIVQVNKESKVTVPIYANGRQQVPIEIVIHARDADGVAVSLNAAQLKAIKLIEYESGAAVGNVSDTKDARYVYEFPLLTEDGTAANAEAREEGHTPTNSAQTIVKYVHKSTLSSNWIAAEIVSPSGGVFRTNTPNPPAGKFDSWIKLQGRQPVAIPWDDFAMTRQDHVTNPRWDVDLYFVYFTEANLRIVASIKYGSAGPDAAHYSWIKSGKQVQHVAYPVGARRTVTHRSCANPSDYTLIQINTREGQANVARIKDSRTCGSFVSNGVLMGYINQYGNESKVAIRGSSNGNTLHLASPNSKDDDPLVEEIDE